MLGLNLFKHTLKMLFHDPWATVRLTVFPLFIAGAIMFGLFYTFLSLADFENVVENATNTDAAETGTRFFLVIGFSLAAYLAAFLWAAVGWHRFVLLDEKPGLLLPKFNGDFIGSYLWAAVRVFFVAFLLMIPILVVIGLVALPDDGLIIRVVATVLMIAFTALIFRVSLVLPSAAVGHPMSLRQSWQATDGYFGALMLVAIAVTLLNRFASLSPEHLSSGIIVFFLMMFLNWLSIAVGISLLTTLYGVCIEKREL